VVRHGAGAVALAVQDADGTAGLGDVGGLEVQRLLDAKASPVEDGQQLADLGAGEDLGGALTIAPGCSSMRRSGRGVPGRAGLRSEEGSRVFVFRRDGAPAPRDGQVCPAVRSGNLPSCEGSDRCVSS
jgi:hypothetical protein